MRRPPRPSPAHQRTSRPLPLPRTRRQKRHGRRDVIAFHRVAQAAFPLRLDVDPGLLAMVGAGPGQPVERAAGSWPATVLEADLSGWRWGSAYFWRWRRSTIAPSAALATGCYGAGAALLIAVLLFGRMVGGARRWFDLGPVHLQPSELMKVLIIVALGKYLNDSPALEGRTFKHMAIPVAIVTLPVLAIAKPARFGHRVHDLPDLHHRDADGAAEAEDAGGHHGDGVDLGVAHLAHGLHEYQRKRVEALLRTRTAPRA